MPDYILGGQAHGDVAEIFLASGGDPNALRPFRGRDGRTYITVNNGFDNKGNPKYRSQVVHNANATLRKDEWILLDRVVVDIGRTRLRAVADLRERGLVYNVPGGMGVITLEYQRISDVTGATVSMDGVRSGESDRPEFDLAGLPLPIIYKDFHFTTRQILVSRRMGTPLDTTMAEYAARKVAEEAEAMLIGSSAAYAYGGNTIYGYTSFPGRLTQALTAPTAGGWLGSTLIAEILSMIQKAQDDFHTGPYVLYVSRAWSKYLGDDYSAAKGTNTLRQRIQDIEEISSIRTLDGLSGFDILLVQMSSDNIREVIGMDMTTLQWPSHGGMQRNFKVMAIMVPQIRTDMDANTGIVHGSVPP